MLAVLSIFLHLFVLFFYLDQQGYIRKFPDVWVLNLDDFVAANSFPLDKLRVPGIIWNLYSRGIPARSFWQLSHMPLQWPTSLHARKGSVHQKLKVHRRLHWKIYVCRHLLRYICMFHIFNIIINHLLLILYFWQQKAYWQSFYIC